MDKLFERWDIRIEIVDIATFPIPKSRLYGEYIIVIDFRIKLLLLLNV